MNEVTFGLIADAVPADRDHDDRLVYHNVAVAFARIVRARGHRLIVQADSATTLSVLLGAAQYYKPAPLETEIRPSKSLFLLPPIDRSLYDAERPEYAEYTDLFKPSERQREETDEDDTPQSFAAALSVWSGVRLSDDREYHSIEDIGLWDRMMEMKPRLFVVLGATDRMGDTIERLTQLSSELEMPVFSDGCKTMPDRFGQRHRTIDMVREKDTYHWQPTLAGERQDVALPEDFQLEIRQAQQEAKLHLALETIVDRLAG